MCDLSYSKYVHVAVDSGILEDTSPDNLEAENLSQKGVGHL